MTFLPITLLKQNIRKRLKKSYLKGSGPAPLQMAAVPAASPAPRTWPRALWTGDLSGYRTVMCSLQMPGCKGHMAPGGGAS